MTSRQESYHYRQQEQMEKIEARDVNFYYGDFHALKGISMDIPQNKVVAFIGPSGCGKSTFLRLFNRMNDLIPGARLEGSIKIDRESMSMNSGRMPGWSSRGPTHSLRVFSTMWPMD